MKIKVVLLIFSILLAAGCGTVKKTTVAKLSEKEFNLKRDMVLGLSTNMGGNILLQKGSISAKSNVVFLGDSVTAGYGASKAFPFLIGDYWNKNGINYHAVNAGVSGWTTENILSAIGGDINDSTALVFLEIGGNDALRDHVFTATIKKNIQAIIDKCKARKIPIALAGLTLPMSTVYDPNADYESKYNYHFNLLYHELAIENHVAVMAFFYKNLVTKDYQEDPRYWQSDQLHPTDSGHQILARDILLFLNKNWK